MNIFAQDSVEKKLKLCKQVISDKKATNADLRQLRSFLIDDDYLLRKFAASALAAANDTSKETILALTKNLDSVVDTMKWDLNFADTKDEVTRASAAFALLKLGDKGKAVLKYRVQNAPSVRGKAEAIMALRSSSDPKDTIGLGAETIKIYKSISQVLNPSPVVNSTSLLKDPEFKNKVVTKEWELVKNGAKGKIEYNSQSRTPGSGSLKLVKESHDGELYVRTNQTIKLTAKEKCLVRIYFRADDVPMSSTFQIVFEDKEGNITVGDDKYSGEAQTFMRNMAERKWSKRLAYIEPKETKEYYIGFIFRGNAGTIYVDDVTVPATNVSLNFFPVESQFNETNRVVLSEPVELKNAKLKKVGDKVRLTFNDKAVVPAMHHVLGPTGQFADYALMESIGGINMQVVSLDMLNRDKEFTDRAVWPSVGKYDFSVTFERLEYAIANAPNTNIILNINTSWPPDWIEQNPDHTWQNIKGQRGYGMTSQQLFIGFADALPSGGNFKWWPSPFSEKAISDAQEVVRLFVNELKTKPYANKVIGCHISGGHDGQFNTSGRPCYSPIAKQAFRVWLQDLYKTDEELRKRWNDKSVSLANAEIPDYSKRGSVFSSLFYNPETDQRYIDHTRFQSEQGMIIRDRMAEAFKKYMETPVIGMTWVMGGGRGQGVQNIFFNSKNLDILVGQPTYARRLPGYIGGMRNVAMNSYREHGKMLFKEFDFRTWTRNSTDELYAQRLSSTEGADDFKIAFRKEFMQMFGQGMGFWMYDIGRSHFKDPEMLKTVKEGGNLYRKYELETDVSYRSDVAVVFVDESLQWERRIINTNNGLTLDGHTYFNVAEAGFTFDNYYLADILNNPDLQKYKLYIFKDAWKLSEEQRQEIERKLQKDGKVLVWNYASGYIGDGKFSDKYVSQLTKMDVLSKNITEWPVLKAINSNPYMKDVEGRIGTLNAIAAAMGRGPTVPRSPLNIPRFEIKEGDGVIPLALYEDNKIAIAAKEFPIWTSVHFGMLGSLDGRILNNLAKKAGAHCFVESGVGNVEFNGKLLGIHFVKNGDEIEVNLPYNSRVIDFDTKEVLLQRGKSFKMEATVGVSRFLIVDNIDD
ncbi:beta-galactosidase [Pseudopedobacter beijingensis]|uniref:Beta-galactosidase n=1 Tax=Pseudopedobacter beijingensis TaxID=1207056 RepID=A0ABW4IGZ2_9SPHI